MEDSKVTSLIDYRQRTLRHSAPPAANTSPLSIKPKPKLLDLVRQAVRARHYSPRTAAVRMECCCLTVKDIDFSQNQVVVRSGKGNKDRYTTLPTALKALGVLAKG